MCSRIAVVVLAAGLGLSAVSTESRAQHHEWSSSFGDGESQAFTRVAVDYSGNVVIVGFFGGTIDLGDGPYTHLGLGSGLLVAKLDPDGSVLWSHAYEASEGFNAGALDIDVSGNVVVAGSFSGTLTGTGSPLVSHGIDGFVVKLNASGAQIFARAFGGTSDDLIRDVSVDGSGRIAITGSFDATFDVGGTATPLVGTNDGFVAKLDSSGVGVWSRRFAGDDYDFAFRIDSDTAGNVAVVGFTLSTQLDLGGGPIPSAGGTDDGFVVKLDANGGHLWSRRVGNGDNDELLSVSINETGDVLAAGEVEYSGWVTRYDGSGNARWTRRNTQLSTFVTAIPGTDESVIWGTFRGVLDLGVGTAVSPEGLRDFFIAKLDAMGNALWVFDPTGDARRDAADVVAGPRDLVICGAIEGDTDLGGGLLPYAGMFDAFLAKLSAPLTVCGRGTVNLVNGLAQPVLTVNGDAPFASVTTGSPIQVALATSLAGPASAPYVLWIWRRPPTTPLSLIVQSARLGCTENRTPLQGAGSGQPFRCMSGGLPPAVCGSVMTLGNAPSRAPWSLNVASGLSAPGVLTLQALIRDNGAANTPGFSVTNAVVLRVE